MKPNGLEVKMKEFKIKSCIKAQWLKQGCHTFRETQGILKLSKISGKLREFSNYRKSKGNSGRLKEV